VRGDKSPIKEVFDSTLRMLLAYAQHMPKKGPSSERHVRVFRNGRNQAVRIPREFELPVEEAIMRKEGHRLIIEPAPAKSLRAVLAGLKPLREKFPRIPSRPADPVDL
jgi:antitoxin VapB